MKNAKKAISYFWTEYNTFPYINRESKSNLKIYESPQETIIKEKEIDNNIVKVNLTLKTNLYKQTKFWNKILSIVYSIVNYLPKLSIC